MTNESTVDKVFDFMVCGVPMIGNMYKSQPFVVHAIQWTGANYNDVDTFCGYDAEGVSYAILNRGGNEITLFVHSDTMEEWLKVPEGSYVVRGIGGDYGVIDEESFIRMFALISDGDDDGGTQGN